MITQEIAHPDLEPVKDTLRSLANTSVECPLMPMVGEARDAQSLARDDAAIEAQDILSQAEEALVMG
jgi:hypothetical protein